MRLAYAARASTRDVDALFRPPEEVHEAAARSGIKTGIDTHWLNHAVHGSMRAQGEFAVDLELDHLRVMVAQPECLLATDCRVLRTGAQFHDEEDVRVLEVTGRFRGAG